MKFRRQLPSPSPDQDTQTTTPTEPTPDPTPEPNDGAAASAADPDPAGPDLAGEHVAAVEIEGDDPDSDRLDAGAGAAAPGGAGPAPGVIPYETFHRGFCAAFNGAAFATKLHSLAANENDQLTMAASKSLYDTALDWPALRFLIQPRNKWIARAVVMGAFGGRVVVGVRQELAERRQGIGTPANDDTRTSGHEGGAAA